MNSTTAYRTTAKGLLKPFVSVVTVLNIVLFPFVPTGQVYADTHIQGSVFSGVFASEVVFVDGGSLSADESSPDATLDRPDGAYLDLDGGGLTLTFDTDIVNYDYISDIPQNTDLIIIDDGVNDIPHSVSFGYGTPTGGASDGLADNTTGDASYISTVEQAAPLWTDGTQSNIHFYNLSDQGGYDITRTDIFIVIDDNLDLDVDAVQVALPEQPSQNLRCPFSVDSEEDVIVDFSTEFGGERYSLVSKVEPDFVNAFTEIEKSVSDLLPGRYRVLTYSYDGYAGRQNVSQPHEQWNVELVTASGENSFGPTNDLADNVVEADKRDVLVKANNKFNLTQPATSVRATHAFIGDEGANSVTPVCVYFDHAAVISEEKNTAPDIVLDGPDSIQLFVGDEVVEPGFSATDAEDGDLTDDVVVSDEIDNTTPGTYIRTYTVSDSGTPTGEVLSDSEEREYIVKIPGDFSFSCPFTLGNDEEGVIVDFSEDFDGRYSLVSSPVSSDPNAFSKIEKEVSFGLNGTYNIQSYSFDGYAGRESVSQPHEQWNVDLIAPVGSALSMTSFGPTSDLEDLVSNASNIDTLKNRFSEGPGGINEIHMNFSNTGVTKVIAWHAFPEHENPNSVTPVCIKISKPIEAPQCSDGIDNDGDGLVDFPEDPGCDDEDDDDEFNPDSSTTFNGRFIKPVIFYHDPGNIEDGPGSMRHEPDARFANPNHGATTVKFSTPAKEFDYGVPIPEKADMVVTVPTHVAEAEVPDDIEFGYGVPADINDDGFADNTTHDPIFLGFAINNTPSWNPDDIDRPAQILFYDLDVEGFDLNKPGFYLSVEGDLNIDAIQMVSLPVTQCSDGLDNDNDGFIDIQDPECHTDGNADNPDSYDPEDNNESGVVDLPECRDGIDNDGDGLVDFPEDPGCDDEDDDDEYNNPGGGGGGGGGGSRPGDRPRDLPAPEIAGAVTTDVCNYLHDYLRIDFNNDPIEVMKLQAFLIAFEGFNNLEVDGIFDEEVDQAVREFQIRYTQDVLVPWGYAPTESTGYVYYTTRKKVNEIFCQKNFPLDDSQQAEIEEFRNLLAQISTQTVAAQPLADTIENDSSRDDTSVSASDLLRDNGDVLSDDDAEEIDVDLDDNEEQSVDERSGIESLAAGVYNAVRDGCVAVSVLLLILGLLIGHIATSLVSEKRGEDNS